ncbi:hypothetical protein IFM89_003661 [Coptis chinensis]|uniref:Uncharacterized protein n=1 Tax=Coptis chinensis TaxID=261450 RepID=A0A835LQT1_9MAGN|nr:hypothetical protein IFM89_003661 [Coptis chinensis]
MKCDGSFTQSLSRVQISTMAVKDNLTVAGGFHGELICKVVMIRIASSWLFCTKITDGENAITNLCGLYQAAKLWDVRNPSQSLVVLKGRMGAIRAIKFSSDGQFMAMSEPADFVHIYGSQSEYIKEQEIDLFGEIVGISFSADTEALFVAVVDRTYGSLLEYNRKRSNQYLYTII